MANQSLIKILELDGSGNPTGQTRALKSGDTLVVPSAITANDNITLAAAKALKGAGALTIDTAAGADLTLDPAGDLIVALPDAAGASSLLIKDSGDNTVASFNSDGDLTIEGDLIVNGASLTVEGTTVTYEDSLLLFAKDATGAPSLDVGFIGERGDSQNVFFGWDESADQFVAALVDDTGTTGTVTVSDYADLRVGGMAVDDTLTVGGGSTFTGAADFDAGITLAGGQSITGDGGLTIENGGAASINIVPADQLNVTFADAAGAKKVNFYNNAITVVASIDSAGAVAAKSLVLTSGATVTAILDEDNMASDSATALATQQSIKAYVDANAGGASAIDDLSDVTITAVGDGEVLQYDNGTSQWINQTLAEAGIQAQADVLDDLATLGASTGDGEFLVATGAGALAWESGATARTSLGVGTSDAPAFAGLDLSGEQTFSGYTAATTGGAGNNQLFRIVDNGVNEGGSADGAKRARLPDVSSSGSFASARINGVWKTGSKAVLHGRATLLVEDNVAIAIGDELVASANTAGRVTKMGATGAPAAGDFLVRIGSAEAAVAAGTDATVSALLNIQPPEQL